MNYLTDIQPRQGDGVSDVAIAQAINNDPSRFVRLSSPALLEWLAGGARFAKIEGWIAATAASEVEGVIGLRAALRVLLMAASNPDAYLSLEPGSDQRQLLTFAVAAAVISQDDADALLAKAKIGVDVSAADVAAARGFHARRTAIATETTKANAFIAKLETWATSGDGDMPTWGGAH